MTENKADYVRAKRAEGHDGRHTCHWPGCTTRVPPAMWGCTFHWYRLPKRLRDKIWMHFKPGQEVAKNPTKAYLLVASEVQEWIKDFMAGGAASKK